MLNAHPFARLTGQLQLRHPLQTMAPAHVRRRMRQICWHPNFQQNSSQTSYYNDKIAKIQPS
jgi:hypothetical protein